MQQKITFEQPNVKWIKFTVIPRVKIIWQWMWPVTPWYWLTVTEIACKDHKPEEGSYGEVTDCLKSEEKNHLNDLRPMNRYQKIFFLFTKQRQWSTLIIFLRVNGIDMSNLYRALIKKTYIRALCKGCGLHN